MFVSQPLQKDKIVTIKHNKYTMENEIPNDVLRTGQQVRVLKSGNLYQSRPNAPPIAYTTVLFRDGRREAYFTTNLA